MSTTERLANTHMEAADLAQHLLKRLEVVNTKLGGPLPTGLTEVEKNDDEPVGFLPFQTHYVERYVIGTLRHLREEIERLEGLVCVSDTPVSSGKATR